MIEMTKEMYNFDDNGYTYYEKAIKFLRNLFERMSSNLTSHEITLIMFGRLYYPQCENKADIQKILFQNDPYISSETLDQLQN